MVGVGCVPAHQSRAQLLNRTFADAVTHLVRGPEAQHLAAYPVERFQRMSQRRHKGYEGMAENRQRRYSESSAKTSRRPKLLKGTSANVKASISNATQNILRRPRVSSGSSGTCG